MGSREALEVIVVQWQIVGTVVVRGIGGNDRVLTTEHVILRVAHEPHPVSLRGQDIPLGHDMLRHLHLTSFTFTKYILYIQYAVLLT